jgi:uncharacterized protein (TIGR03083 family)
VTDLATYVRALSETWSGMASACTNLLPAQWDAPTEVPGWSVKDNVSHIVGVELILLGEPDQDHPVPDDVPYIRNDAGRFMEAPVRARRPVPGPEVLRELRSVTARRLAELRELSDGALEEEVPGIFRQTKLRHLLGIRVFDSWTHEQDVRRALGHPGGLSGEAARLSLRRLLLALTGLASDVPAAAGRTVCVVTTGAVPSESTLRLGEDASYTDGLAASCDVRIDCDFETFLRLGTGRVPYAPGVLTLSGDEALGAELCRHLAVTP